jgi:hypothetical protein
MYKKTPKSTDIGICLRRGAAKIESPIINETKKPERRCSLMSAIFGESPGAWFLEIFLINLELFWI